ncbi:hypothetical protein MTsPCn5_07690 [Croceitalea sp. MTPC5]|uniref:DUF7019 family protein n=1 Tax=Croceitalea sp. MTPC5 TaxID=3056565 RepID=UPI002B381B23|nr:hypothetical protein MTsPCn5_07690 [Croceitalea sp. MTPC5]
MKSYIYISESKLKHLFQQLPDNFKGIDAEIKAKFLVIEAAIKTGNIENTTISMLDEVTKYLEKKTQIGTIEYPGEWVKEKVIVRPIKSSLNPSLFGLVGKLPEIEHYFLLGGSKRNVIGNLESGEYSTANSYWPYLVEAIVESYENIEKNSGHLMNDKRYKINHSNIAAGVNGSELASTIRDFYRMVTYPEFEVEFLGKHLATEYFQDWSMEAYKELGIENPDKSSFFTPLYVRYC